MVARAGCWEERSWECPGSAPQSWAAGRRFREVPPAAVCGPGSEGLAAAGVQAPGCAGDDERRDGLAAARAGPGAGSVDRAAAGVASAGGRRMDGPRG